jgi:predicted DsbA family dithiol-disulfide isomerase
MKGRPDNPLQARAKQLGITMVERDRIPSSRRAHECTEYARAQGKLHAFHAAVLKAYWTEGKDLHDWAVLEELARGAGLDAVAMRDEVTARAWKTAVDERVQGAHDLGIHAVPTFLFADKFIVQGAQTLDVLEKVMARVTSEPRS